jgi:hypothetical protein
MIDVAIFHTYVDGVGAAIDWLVDWAQEQLKTFADNQNQEATP